MFLNYFRRVTSVIWSLAKVSCFVWLLSSPVVAAAGGSISGSVLDTKGAAIEKAQVFIRADASCKRKAVKDPNFMIETDKEGHFSATVTSGFYDVCVMADAFSPHCEKVFVGQEIVAPKINLKADLEVMKRLGDTF